VPACLPLLGSPTVPYLQWFVFYIDRVLGCWQCVWLVQYHHFGETWHLHIQRSGEYGEQLVVCYVSKFDNLSFIYSLEQSSSE